MKREPRILEPSEITVVAGRRGLPWPRVDGRPLCQFCLQSPCEVKWKRGGYAEGQEVFRPRCFSCRRAKRRYSGPDVLGSRPFPCEGHRWTRCSLCPPDPAWEVPANRLSVLPLYRLGLTGNFDPRSGAVVPCALLAAAFFKWEAIEQFGAASTRRAWVSGLTASDADEWAARLTGWNPRNVWTQWEWLAEREDGRPSSG